jgi:hypothetical protein
MDGSPISGSERPARGAAANESTAAATAAAKARDSSTDAACDVRNASRSASVACSDHVTLGCLRAMFEFALQQVNALGEQADLAQHGRRRERGEHLGASVLDHLHRALEQHDQALPALSLFKDGETGLRFARHHRLEDLLGLLVRQAAAQMRRTILLASDGVMPPRFCGRPPSGLPQNRWFCHG